MSGPVSCLYVGEVVHRRVQPVKHVLRYKVYNFFVDVDELAGLGKRLRWFSYNRFNIFSISDRKFGPGDGTAIRDHVWSLVKASDGGADVWAGGWPDVQPDRLVSGGLCGGGCPCPVSGGVGGGQV